MNGEQLAADLERASLLTRLGLVQEGLPTQAEQDEFLNQEAAATTDHQARVREGFDTLFRVTGFVHENEMQQICPEIVLDEFEYSELGKGKLVARVINYPRSGDVGTYVGFVSESGQSIHLDSELFSPEVLPEDYASHARASIDEYGGQFIEALHGLRTKEEHLKKSEETLNMLSQAAFDSKLNPELVIRADISNPQQPQA